MNFGDIFKKTFLEQFGSTQGEISTNSIFCLALTAAIALYIFFVYRIVTRKTFYNKNMNIALAALSIITAAVILAVQSSIVISLGMVGALSIVRFRTAIKDPMDLVFLFWSISIGIICGAGLIGLALVTSLILTACIFGLERLPISRAAKMLVINSNNTSSEKEIMEVVRKHSKSFRIKSRNYSENRLDMVIEIRLADEPECINDIFSLNCITNASLLSHDGEVTF